MNTAERINQAKVDVAMYLGVPPYNTASNMHQDDDFYKKIVQRHGKRLVEKLIHELNEVNELPKSVAEEVMKKAVSNLSTVARATRPPKITPKVQVSIDQYTELHAQMKDIEKQMKQLRDVIEPYMKENNIGEVKSTDGVSIAFVPQDRPTVTSKYSLYEPDEVEEVLTTKQRAQCIVKRVDAEKLEAMIILGQVDEAIRELKMVNKYNNFTVKR